MPAPIVPIVTAAVAKLVAKHGAKAVQSAMKKIPPPPPGSIKGIRTGGRPSAIRTKAQKKVEKKALKAANKKIDPYDTSKAGRARNSGRAATQNAKKSPSMDKISGRRNFKY
jgi:hypothetical protein